MRRCACDPKCKSTIDQGDTVVPVYVATRPPAKLPIDSPQYALLSHVMAWSVIAEEHNERLAKLESPDAPLAADEAERRVIVAFLLDRADQYSDDACCKQALCDVAARVANGDATEAAKHGELDDDLMRRVERMRTKSNDR